MACSLCGRPAARRRRLWHALHGRGGPGAVVPVPTFRPCTCGPSSAPRSSEAIRDGTFPQPPGPAVVTDGTLGLGALAAKYGTHPATVLRATAEASTNGEYATALATAINTVLAADNVTTPDNLILHYREKWAAGRWRDYTRQTRHAYHPENPHPPRGPGAASRH